MWQLRFIAVLHFRFYLETYHTTSYHFPLSPFYLQATVALNSWVSVGTPPPPCCGCVELNTDAKSDFVSSGFEFYPNPTHPTPQPINYSEGGHLSNLMRKFTWLHICQAAFSRMNYVLLYVLNSMTLIVLDLDFPSLVKGKDNVILVPFHSFLLFCFFPNGVGQTKCL